MTAEGRLPDRHKTPLTQKAKMLMGGQSLPRGTIKASLIKDVTKRPMGSLGPHSSKAVIGGNIAASIIEPGVGLLNAAKFGTETKGFQATRLGKYVEKNFVHKPLTDAFQSGASGKAMSNLKNFSYKYGVNGAVGTAIENAHKAGSTFKAKTGISKP